MSAELAVRSDFQQELRAVCCLMDFCSKRHKSYVPAIAGYVCTAALWLGCRVDVSEIALSLSA